MDDESRTVKQTVSGVFLYGDLRAVALYYFRADPFIRDSFLRVKSLHVASDVDSDVRMTHINVVIEGAATDDCHDIRKWK